MWISSTAASPRSLIPWTSRASCFAHTIPVYLRRPTPGANARRTAAFTFGPLRQMGSSFAANITSALFLRLNQLAALSVGALVRLEASDAPEYHLGLTVPLPVSSRHPTRRYQMERRLSLEALLHWSNPRSFREVWYQTLRRYRSRLLLLRRLRLVQLKPTLCRKRRSTGPLAHAPEAQCGSEKLLTMPKSEGGGARSVTSTRPTGRKGIISFGQKSTLLSRSTETWGSSSKLWASRWSYLPNMHGRLPTRSKASSLHASQSSCADGLARNGLGPDGI